VNEPQFTPPLSNGEVVAPCVAPVSSPPIVILKRRQGPVWLQPLPVKAPAVAVLSGTVDIVCCLRCGHEQAPVVQTCESCGHCKHSSKVSFVALLDPVTSKRVHHTPGFSQLVADFAAIYKTAVTKQSGKMTLLEKAAVFRFCPMQRAMYKENNAARNAAGGSTEFLKSNHPDVCNAMLLEASEKKQWGAVTKLVVKKVALTKFVIKEVVLPLQPVLQKPVYLQSAVAGKAYTASQCVVPVITRTVLSEPVVPVMSSPSLPAMLVTVLPEANHQKIKPVVQQPVACAPVQPKTVTRTSPVAMLQSKVVVKEELAPSVAVPQCDLRLFDLNSKQYLAFFSDTGSSWTILREDEARARGLNVMPWEPELDPGIPAELPLGDSTKHLQVVGICQLRLEVHGDQAIVVNAAVTSTLFCPCILGRNVLSVMDKLYCPSAIKCDNGEFVAEELLPILTECEDGYKSYLIGNVMVPRTTGTHSRVEQQVQVEARIPEEELMFHGRRISEMDGVFTPDHNRNSGAQAHAANAVVCGKVDWGSAGLVVGNKCYRRVVFVTSVVFAIHAGPARRFMSAGHILGRFHVGKVSAAPITAECGKLFQGVLDRTFKISPLLKTRDDKREATDALGGFMFVEELTTAARAEAPPLVIELELGARASAKRNYPMTYEEELFAEEQIRSWLRSGTVRLSAGSPWTSPIVIAYHPRTGKPRLCIDYRSLNAVTIADQYLMPMISNITRAMQGKRVFSKIDLSQGFNQLEIAPESRHLTAFPGPRGQKYEFVGSPFGLRNIPSAFQRMMDRVLGTMLWTRASVYIDDIIVFSDSVKQHHQDLKELASRLRRANIFVKASKCIFYVTEVEYLGYLLSGESVRVMPDRVAGVLKVQKPKTRKELRQFLGLTGQFRHLIYQYAELARSLEAMKHKSSLKPFDLSDGSAGDLAFHSLRDALVKMPELAIPDMNLPFRAYVDASHWAMSMVLCQVQKGVPQVIAFYSKAFGESELIWSTPVKEATALHYFAMGSAWPFLASRGPHEIFVDSLSSNALAKKTLQNHKLVRHAVDLCGLNLVIKRIPGKKNPADYPTRPPFVKIDPHLKFLSESVSPLRLHPGWIEEAKQADAEEEEDGASVVAPLPASNAPIPAAEFSALQKTDAEVAQLLDFIASGRPTCLETATSAVLHRQRLLSRQARSLVIQDDGVLIRMQVLRGVPHKQRVIPVALQASFLEEAHSSSSRGVHGGKHGLAMEEELARTVWWSTMREDCLAYRCSICARQKVPTKASAGLLHSTIASRPGQVVSVDVVPMKKDSGFVAFLIALDKFSGAVAIRNMTVKSSAAAVDAWDASMGSWPLDVTTMRVDRDSILSSKEFILAMAKRGISVDTVFAGHQQANFVERSVKSVKAIIRTTLDGLPTTAWPLVTPSLGRYINTLFQSSKGASPAQICTGWLPQGFLPYSEAADSAVLGHVFNSREELWQRISRAVEQAEKKQATAYNAHRSDVRFPRGSVVLLRNLRAESEDGNFNLSPPFDPNPWIVEAELSEVSVWLRNFEKQTKHMECHVSRLQHAVSEIDPRELAKQADEDAEFVVQKIHSHRKSGAELSYLIEWGGWKDVRSYTWEPRSNLEAHAKEILTRYNQLYGIQ
jgi:hypothetical protein